MGKKNKFQSSNRQGGGNRSAGSSPRAAHESPQAASHGTTGKSFDPLETELTDLEKKKPFHDEPDEDCDWDPDFGQIFKWSLGITIASALWAVINDCDEVYNFYEPLHMFLYGHGFQTWEYSPTYALRSYLYILIHALPSQLFVWFFGEQGKIAVFTMIRLTIGTVFALGECYAYQAIAERINISTARFFLLFSWFSSGVFMARTAFLPSSFAMIVCVFLIGSYLKEQWAASIFLVAFASIIGWPFAALLGIPIVIEMIFLRGKLSPFFLWSVLAGVLFTGAQAIMDQYYYGRQTISVLNMITYNVNNNKSSLYGVASVMYYIKNLFLNWNIASFFALGSIFLTTHLYMEVWPVPEDVPKKFGLPRSYKYWERFVPIFLLFATMSIWCFVFFIAAHKEERFLFPIYPLIALFAALFCDAITRIWPSENYTDFHGVYIAVISFAVLSASRSYGTYVNYSGHVDIYKSLQDELFSHYDFKNFHSPIRVCVGKEWHHFPSNFFIPQYAVDIELRKREVELQFLKSDFHGILPKPFKRAEHPGDRTKHVPADMNDDNREEHSRYVPLDTCDYVIDVDYPATQNQQDFRTMKDQFKPIVQFPVIDADKSSMSSRAFYIPFLSGQNVYTNCTLYRNIPRLD